MDGRSLVKKARNLTDTPPRVVEAGKLGDSRPLEARQAEEGCTLLTKPDGFIFSLCVSFTTPLERSCCVEHFKQRHWGKFVRAQVSLHPEPSSTRRPATFNLWEPQIQSFRLPNKDERKWIHDTFNCERYSIADPFLMLCNPKILPKSLTVGSLVVVMCGENEQPEELLPFHREQLGKIRILDPMVLFAGKSPREIAKTEGAVSPQDLPGRLAGRNASWFIDSEIYPQQRTLSKQNIIPPSTTPDGSTYDPIRAGVRVTCQDGSMSTTLGFSVAMHGFPGGDNVLHPFNENIIGRIVELYPSEYLALVEPASGVRFDPHDYFEVKLVLRLFKSHELITPKGGCNLECLSGWDMSSWQAEFAVRRWYSRTITVSTR
ncbi:hypothetical protein K440DRAFT_663724 [Wilcoxina mikolae CBS 423.85]|nr:hypothetical protein K440DRAFT_663724 [Wilcoxina mikolae CBS 423.85]